MSDAVIDAGTPASVCAVCGLPVSPADLAPELERLSASARLPMHAECFRRYLARSREAQDAWSRTPRGRLTRAWLGVRAALTMAAAAAATIVAAGPIAALHAGRSWRLRRAVRRTLDAEIALVVVGVDSGRPDAAEIRGTFSPAWASALGLRVAFVDTAAGAAEGGVARAAWDHWGRAPKPPEGPSVVLVPRRGPVERWSIARGLRMPDRTPIDRLAAARDGVESVVARHSRDVGGDSA